MTTQPNETIEPEKFDMRTHIRDSKTGKIIVEQPYRLWFTAYGEVFERPIGSGTLWNSSGKKLDHLCVKGEEICEKPKTQGTKN
jgi:hypothetical protein